MSGETKKTVVCLVGFAAYCAMLRAPFFGSLTTGITTNFSELRVVYDVALILLGCVLALVSLSRSKRLHKSLLMRGNLVPYAATGAFAIVGVLANSAGRILGTMTDAFYVVSIVALCIGFAALTVGWFCVLVELARDKIAVLATGAFVVSHVFGILDILPRGWASILSALYPLLALIALCVLQRDYAASCSHREQEPPLKDSYLRKVQICAMALIFAEIFCGAFLRSRWAHGGVNYIPHSRTFYSYLVSAVIGVFFWFIVRRSKTTAECALAIGSFGLIGFMVATVLFAFASPSVLSPFVTGLYSALLVYSIALISLWGIDNRHSFLACSAFFLITYGLASGITSSIIPALLAHLQLSPTEFLAPVSVAAGIAVSLGMCAVLFIMVIVHRQAFLGKLQQGAERKPDDLERTPSLAERHDLAMDMLAERYDLTERERETASLIARGYTARRVAEELVVAESTVKGYSKSIYRKMGIHRKDELIAMVNELKKQV